MDNKTLRRVALYSLALFLLISLDVAFWGYLKPLDISLNLLTPAPTLSSAFVNLTTVFGTEYFIIAAILFLTYIAFRKRSDLILPTLFSLVMVVAAYSILKGVFGIPRPSSWFIEPSGYSFPSGHSTLAAFLFTIFIHYLKTYYPRSKWLKIIAGVIALIIMLLIGFSRLYLGVHWFSDVIGGFALGLTLGSLTVLTYNALNGSRRSFVFSLFKFRKRKI